MKKIFIDGSEGTTGLKIYERIAERKDIELITIDHELRKDPTEVAGKINSSDITFLCLPDAAAKEAVTYVENPDTVIIDTSTAHRTAEGWTYGFAELDPALRDQISKAKRIANPGCHASGFISLVYPLIKCGILKKDARLCSFSLTGYSGGGKKMIAEYEASDRATALDSPRQYGLTQQHKHLNEMKIICGLETSPMFSPIVADYFSGMEVSVYIYPELCNVKPEPEMLREAYAKHYENAKLIKVNDAVNSSNFFEANLMSGKDSMIIDVTGNEERMIVTSRFDNLGKGASGAALQNMNIAMNTEETTGLIL